MWLAVVGVSGCSLALDGPKPNRPRGYAPKCDDSKGLVVADGLLATTMGIAALSAFGQDETEAGVVLGLIGVAFTASAIRGNGVVNECRGEQALFAQENAPQFAPTDPENEQPTGRYAGPVTAAPRAPVATAAPVTAPAAPTTPSDPYAEPRIEQPPPPVRPATSAPAAIKPPARPTKPAPADVDADAWRDFWTEVP